MSSAPRPFSFAGFAAGYLLGVVLAHTLASLLTQ